MNDTKSTHTPGALASSIKNLAFSIKNVIRTSHNIVSGCDFTNISTGNHTDNLHTHRNSPAAMSWSYSNVIWYRSACGLE